ncbi:MAG: C1 family peptidase [Bacteroidales bacterium]
MIWFADTTSVSILSFHRKQKLFGIKYNLCGLEYYAGGVFDPIPGTSSIDDVSSLISSWDWRERHDANINTSHYYDGDISGTGWLTGAKDQTVIESCQGLCYIYGPLGAIEGVANLYFNHHVDYYLSVQHVLDCDLHSDNECNGGFVGITNMFVRDSGVVNESYYPRDEFHGICRIPNPPGNGQLEYRVKITGSKYVSYPGPALPDQIKDSLINFGPLIVSLKNYVGDTSHAISLIGYKVLQVNDFFLKKKQGGGFDTITVQPGSTYIGKLAWLYKNSWGTNWGENGFAYHLHEDFYPSSVVHYYHGIDDILTIYDTVVYRDADNDGYYNWGIGPRPEGVPNNYLQDWNDNNNRIGPRDENYYGIPVAPEIEVYDNQIGIGSKQIHRNGFYSFNQNNTSLSFRIINPGSAALNLNPFPNPITFAGPDADKFAVSWTPEYKINMFGGETEFTIGFSTDEPDSMHIAYLRIDIAAIDEDVLEDFWFALVYNGCHTHEGVIEITSDITWDEPFTVVRQDLNIARNATLTIKGNVAFTEDADIFVDAGCKLIIDGGKLTSVCGTLWNGIDVWGDSRMPQTAQYQGTVSVINGGCIEYAVRGIETAEYDGYGHWYPTGGIVSCNNALLKDNLIDVYFFPYTNRHPVTQDILPNFSRFSKTTFKTTDDLYDIMALVPSSRIFMDEVGGIVFSGCTFGNYSTRNDQYRGKGIESHGSGYYITSDCLYQIHPCSVPIPSRFENLDYGIRAFNNNGYFTVTVDSAEFHHNRRGAHFRFMGYPAVIKSTFDITDPDGLWTQDEMVGLYLDAHTTGFKIEENQFFGSSPSTNIGMHLLNTGTVQNEIYNNSFTSLLTGIVAAGENRLGNTGAGLCIKCNDFMECTTDVFVTYEEDEYGNPIITENTGIALKQGDEGNDNTAAAGNTFSENAEFNYFNDDGCKHIDYTYHGDNPPDNIIPSNYAGEFTPLSDDDAEYSKSGSCPSHLGGGINPSLENFNLSIETSMISAYQDTLQLLVDGGNTEALNYEVISSYPQEALVVRQNLLNASPYLSDTVMISAIEKEEVLPNAMIRDILVANPQAPKSHVVMNALEQRQAPVPEYMVAEIMQGTGTYGAKELLEQQLGRHIAARDEAWGKLNLFCRNDTLNPSSYDSLIVLLENENRLAIKYDLAFLYLERQDSSDVFALLENMPSGFYLSERELMVHGLYTGLFELLWDLKSDSGSLDSTKLTILSGMASHYPVIPAVYAANMLIKAGVWLYEEPVYLPNPLKTKPVGGTAPGEQIRAGRLKVFPNPAGTYVIAEYDLGGLEPPFSITLTNLQGIDLRTIPVKDRLNQIIIPTMEYSPGVYFIRLHAGKGLIDSKKITIIR